MYKQESTAQSQEEQNNSPLSLPQEQNDQKEEKETTKEEETINNLLLELERRIEGRREKESQYFNRRIDEIQNQLEEARNSALEQELEGLNRVAKHNNLIVGELEEMQKKLSDFFSNIAVTEYEKGQIGAYEEALIMLRTSQKTFAICHTEIQSQKLEWNRLVERLRSMQLQSQR